MSRSRANRYAGRLPAGFVRFTVDRSEVVCAEHVADAVRAALGQARTLYAYAGLHPLARPLAGRGTAYAAPLPKTALGAERVVVRHNRHGGKLAPLTRDWFLPPTRAPLELEVWERLCAAGVPAPVMLGYAVYPAFPGFRTADVMTREVPRSADLSTAIMSADPDARLRAWRATAYLIAALTRAGAHHHDLNVKNVLLHDTGDALDALVLDVDRVTFTERGGGAVILEANLARLLRSARKWRALHGAPLTDSELDAVAGAARALVLAPPAVSASS